MNIASCEQCGDNTPEGFSLCPSCMRKSGAAESDVIAARELLEIANIVNMGDTEKSHTAAIKSILNIKNRLESNSYAEKEEKQEAPQQKADNTRSASSGQSSATAHGGH